MLEILEAKSSQKITSSDAELDHDMNGTNEEGKEHDNAPGQGGVSHEKITAKCERDGEWAILLMCSPILTADPTELSSTTRASHVITGAILCDWNLTADTFSDQEIARQGAIKYDLILAQSLMVCFTAFEACSCITCGTGGLFLARTTRSLNDSATVSR